ncbi:MAG: hypothetical protein ACRD3D_17515 [Terriglobia bacterium]
MAFFSFFRKLDRRQWFICYQCLGDSNHDETRSVFHSRSPKVLVVGRPWQQCPRCGGTNTKSFAELKEEGLDSALWGLERIVKKNPRGMFEVEHASGAVPSSSSDALHSDGTRAR